MSGTKVDIQWSPIHDNLFIASGSAITLYSVKDEVETDQSVVQGDKHVTKPPKIVQVDCKSDLPLMKCVSWCPRRDLQNVFAISQTNGRINIAGFGGQTDDIIGKEFNVRYNRQCSYLSWNPQETNLLAQGLERYRNEPSILIWDVMRDVAMDISDRSRHSFSEGPLTKPFCETGGGEGSHSLSWFPEDPKVFVTGMSKHIRVYDVRDTNKHRSAASHRCVFGVCIDPIECMRVASYNESNTAKLVSKRPQPIHWRLAYSNLAEPLIDRRLAANALQSYMPLNCITLTGDMVAIWDLRSFDKPISLITENKAVIKLSWCPTRSGLLSVLCKDNSFVKLHDMRLALFGSDDLEQTYIARNIQPLPRSPLVSFSWHPRHENKMMTVMPNGHLKELVMFERSPVTWSSNLKLARSVNEDKMNCSKVDKEDVSDVMKRRVKSGYGMDHQNIAENMKAIETEQHLHGLWKWLYNIRALEDNEAVRTKQKLPLAKGIMALLHLEEYPLNSELAFMNWKASEGVKYTRKRMYKSPERSLALQICGWSADQDVNNVNTFICSIVAAQELERAAAVALFNLHIKFSLDILSSSAKRDSPDRSTLQAVAMALSGYTEEKHTLWHKTCDALRSQLEHPYLQAIFAFLAAEDDNYEEVLNSISVEDRIAFALIYLPDAKTAYILSSSTARSIYVKPPIVSFSRKYELKTYLLRLCEDLTEKGNLDGILLTGLSPRGINLLGRYMDLTSDVQTTALAAVFSASSDVMENSHVMLWVDGYRDLLDRWKMWHERAWFDIVRQNLVQDIKVPPQILVSCTFCGKSVTSNMSLMSKFRSTISSVLSRGSQNRVKVTCCQGCRKAFPRCAICLNNMGTLSGAGIRIDLNKGEKLSPFEEWFTWCQTCRHGGHAGHIIEWFREHIECPVTGCSCECVGQDAVSQRLIPATRVHGAEAISKS